MPSVWAKIASSFDALLALRLGLVTQRDFNLRALRGKAVNVDVSAEEFDAAYSRPPILAKLIPPLLLPIYGLYFLFNGSREQIAKQLATTDLPVREQILDSNEETDALDDLLLRAGIGRTSAAEWFFEQSPGKSLTVGVIYGAAHTPGSFRFLSGRLKYRVKSSSWALAFPLA